MANPKHNALENSKEPSKKKVKPYDHVGAIMQYEDGSLDEKGTKKLFQHLVDTGLAWHLQGSYGRAANEMLNSGFIKKPKHGGKGQQDAYGNSMEDYYKRK